MFAKAEKTMAEIPATVDPLLVTILSWPRPHGSDAEISFRAWLRYTIKEITGRESEILAHGCIYIHEPHLSGTKATTLFSCHVDTMDLQIDGKFVDDKPVSKSLTYDPNMGVIGLAKESSGNCLGADDGGGIWIMLNMLQAKVPGGYIFHTEEERGGIGARAVLARHADLLKTFEVAVAFDRPGDYEVITHQGGVECASQKFCLALVDQLKQAGLPQYVLSNRGIFTDTKVYRDIIAECTNIGIGYTGQHARGEDLDYAHIAALNKACIGLNWSALPVDRDPVVVPIPTYYQKNAFYTPPKKKSKKLPKYEPSVSEYDVLSQTDAESLSEWVNTDSEGALAALVSLMTEVAQLRSEVMLLRSLAGIATSL